MNHELKSAPEQDEAPQSLFEEIKKPGGREPFLKRLGAPFTVMLLLLLCGLCEYSLIVSNPAPREIAFMQNYFMTSAVTALPASAEQTAPVDQLLARCPSRAEVEALQADLDLRFETDPDNGVLACKAADGSLDLTTFQMRFYNTLLVIKATTFSQPLPWTTKSLYAWFVEAVDGIRVRSDVDLSYCCDPGDVLNIRSRDLPILYTGRWLDPQTGDGAISLFLMLIHEARHAEGFYHNCGNADKRLTELGAWGTQYFLDVWLAKYSDKSFFAASDVDYRVFALQDAQRIEMAYICQKPTREPPSNR